MQISHLNISEVRYYYCVFNDSNHILENDFDANDPSVAKVFLYVKGL